MRKKVLSLILLWAALLALALIYTDRDEYTWRYEGGELAQIVITREEADARQKQADEAMALMQQAAQARTDAGLWGSENEWEDDFLPAQGENGGLNLMWGDYQATIEYEDAARMDAHVVSAGYQAFIENGDAHDEAEAENVLLHRLSFVFRLTDSTPNLYLASENPEAIRAVTVHKVGAGVLSADLCAYAALAGAVLTALLVLSWDQTERGRKNRRDMAVVLCAAAFACMPLLWRGVYDGHDLFFHLNRIEGIANGLRNGQFPVRIHSSTLLGYGYAAPEFYPELFLYFPALLRNLGVSLCACVRVFEACIHLATAVSCYLCVRGMMNSRRVAVGASVLYTLCIYRLVNVYTRATLGESLAMVFFPVVMLGLYEVLRRDEKKWPLLALGMTGVCMSHLLSTMFCVLFCAIAALASVGKLLARKRRILAVLAAAGVTALCALWFFVPMMQYTADGISTSVVLNSSEYVHRPGSFLVGFAGDVKADAPEDFAYTIGVVPGLALLIGCALLLARRYAAGRAEMKTENDRLALGLLALGALALGLSTDFFPWRTLCSIRKPFSTFFMQIQFPWRFVGMAVPMLSAAAGAGRIAFRPRVSLRRVSRGTADVRRERVRRHPGEKAALRAGADGHRQDDGRAVSRRAGVGRGKMRPRADADGANDGQKERDGCAGHPARARRTAAGRGNRREGQGLPDGKAGLPPGGLPVCEGILRPPAGRAGRGADRRGLGARAARRAGAEAHALPV